MWYVKCCTFRQSIGLPTQTVEIEIVGSRSSPFTDHGDGHRVYTFAGEDACRRAARLFTDVEGFADLGSFILAMLGGSEEVTDG